MPVTLLEGMSSLIPIACSISGPMPEILQSGGVYFDPKKADSIAEAIENLILNEQLRNEISCRAYKRASEMSWAHCASKTLSFLVSTLSNYNR
ncbi:glycosyltransferase [Chlorobium phaeovibrioides]